MLGQYLGAFFGSAILYGVYSDLIGVVGQGKLLVADNGTATATAGIFATYPYAGVSTGTLLFDQVTAVAIVIVIVIELFFDRMIDWPSAARLRGANACGTSSLRHVVTSTRKNQNGSAIFARNC